MIISDNMFKLYPSLSFLLTYFFKVKRRYLILIIIIISMVKKRGQQKIALPPPEVPQPPATITLRRATTTPLGPRFKRWPWGFTTYYLPMFFFMMWLIRMVIKIQPLVFYLIYGDVMMMGGGGGGGTSCRGVPHVDSEPIAYEIISTDDFSNADVSTAYASTLEYFTQLNREPTSAMGWYAVGLALSPEEEVELRGRSYNRRQCFVQALEKNPHMMSAWNNLARLLKLQKSITSENGDVIIQEEEETVEIGGQTFSIKQCHVNALELDETLGVMWGNLGTYLFTNATDVAVVSGAPYTGKECLVRALEWDPELHAIWNNLGTTLGKDENGVAATIQVSGETYDRMQCYVRAFGDQPRHLRDLDKPWKQPHLQPRHHPDKWNPRLEASMLY